MTRIPRTEILELPVADLPEPLPPSEAEREKIDRRLKAYRQAPEGVSPWPEVKGRILGRR